MRPIGAFGSASLFGDERAERRAIVGDELGDLRRAHLRDDDETRLTVALLEEADLLHALHLRRVIVGRREVVNGRRLIAMDEEELREEHQALASITRIGVLIADREDLASAAILHGGEDHIEDLLLTLVDTKLKELGARRMRPEVDAEIRADALSLLPLADPACEDRGRSLGLHKVLVLRRASAHGLRRGGAARDGHQRGVEARAADERLRRAVGRLEEAELPLETREREHAVVAERRGELLASEPVDLMAAVGDEVEDEADLPDGLRELAHLIIRHPGRIPVEGGREVIGEHLLGVDRVDRVGELLGLLVVGGLRLHPDDVAEGRRRERLRDGVIDAAANLIVAFRRARKIVAPRDVDAERLGLLTHRDERGVLRELAPLVRAHRRRLTLVGAELDDRKDRLTIGLEAGLFLPKLSVAGLELVVELLGDSRRALRFDDLLRRLFNIGDEAGLFEPAIGVLVLSIRKRRELIPERIVDTELVHAALNREIGALIARHIEVRRAKDEGLIALITVGLHEGRCLGVGTSDDDARDAHHIELKASGVEALDLLLGADKDLTALVTALLGAGLLILDVVTRDANLDEAADEVTDMRISAMTGICIRDDEGAIVDRRVLRTLLLRHAAAKEVLVLIGRKEGADEDCSLIGHLAERIAREVRARILLHRTLRGGRPAAEVDALDADALHRHGLTGRIGAEGRDLLALGEKLAEKLVELFRILPRDRIICLDRALLLSDRTRRVESLDLLESRALKPCLRLCDLLFKGLRH